MASDYPAVQLATINEEKAATISRNRNFGQYSTIALLCYDYLLTLGPEVEYIWGQRFRLSTALYIFCRYALVTSIFNPYVFFGRPGSQDFCDAWYKVISSLSLFGKLAIIVTFAARTYAICNCNRYVLGSLVALGLAWIILSVIHVVQLDCQDEPGQPIGMHCLPLPGDATPFIPAIEAVINGAMCLFEFSSAFITFGRCVQTLRGVNARAYRLFGLLLEQGVLYLVFSAFFTIIIVVLYYRPPPELVCQDLLSAIALQVSCTLTARFLLHLRWLQERSYDGGSGESNSRNITVDRSALAFGSLRLNSTEPPSVMEDFGVNADLRENITRTVTADTHNN